MAKDLIKLAAESFGERGTQQTIQMSQKRGGGLESILGLFSSAAGIFGNLFGGGGEGGQTPQIQSLAPDKDQLSAINKAAARQQSTDDLIDSLLSGI